MEHSNENWLVKNYFRKLFHPRYRFWKPCCDKTVCFTAINLLTLSDALKINTPIHTLNTASSIGFKLVTITEKSFTAPDVAHRHNYWAMFYFLKGKGRHLIDFSEIEIRPGSIHFVMPGQVHELDAKKNFLAYGILFQEEFFLTPKRACQQSPARQDGTSWWAWKTLLAKTQGQP